MQTIFVSVASYRDDVCSNTIKSLYENAEFPQRIFVGICQQNADEDMDCVENLNSDKIPQENIRIIRLHNTEAKGPTYARYLCTTLWKGEDFFLQIDSHSLFVKSWDTKCIDMINRIKSEGLSQKPVISHYPLEDTDYTNNRYTNRDVPRVCRAYFNDRGVINFHEAEIIDTKDEFYRVPFSTGGMLFAPSSILIEVPYDPNLPYLFAGEEVVYSLRLFTNGYDVFTPTENILYHEYTRETKPKFWSDLSYDDSDAISKVKYYLGLLEFDKLPKTMHIDLDKYGPGKVRSVSEFLDFAKIDTKAKLVYSNFCKPDNKASNDDIEKSNELKENFACMSCNSSKSRLIFRILVGLIILSLIAIILIIGFVIKKRF